jgi:UTP-glucose-1-phosphate uridylyltransferase
MEVAYRGELITTSRCGRMDQACAFGKKPRLITFDGDLIEVKPVSISKPMYWVFADLNKGKDTKRILNDLNKCYPFARDETDKLVQETLGKMNKEIIDKALAAFAAGDASQIGYLMTESQRLFDDRIMPLSFEELSAPMLHSVLNNENIKKWAWGGKGVGSQGDGAVQFIAKGKQEQKMLVDYLKSELHLTAYSLDFGGKKSVRKAVIPLAGYGTRLFPASKSVKKELFPIIDRDGIAKPALLLTLEELDKSGIEEICLVISESDEQIYQSLFKEVDNNEYLEKLSPKLREYDKKLKRIGEKITFVYQNERLGFGHAVFQARNFAEDEPILLALGDHVFISDEDSTCAAQAIESFENNTGLMVLVQEVPLEQVSHYGIVSGEWIDAEERNLNVTGIFEKPDIKFAREYLGIKHRNGNTKYYSVFGQYILTPEVFEV